MAVFTMRITMAGLVALMLGCGGAQVVEAQAALLGPGAAFIGGGVSGIGTQELDDRLAAHGYPTFGTTAVAVNVGAYRMLSSGTMLGAEWHGLIMGEEVREGREVGLGGGYGTVGVGYVVDLSSQARVYPRLGIGGGGMGVWFEDESDTIGFGEVLANPTPTPGLREPVLSRGGLVLDAGGGVEFLPLSRGSGPLIGLRLGYLLAPFDSDWDFYERTALGGPDATISGLYARLIVGGAWRR